MIKGCQKQAVIIKCSAESVFESAHFILKRGMESRLTESELLYEANMLVKRNSLPSPKRHSFKKWLFPALSFCAGIIVGVAITLILSILFY